MAITVQTWTVSKLMEVSARGEKHSEFLSMKFGSDVSLTPELAAVQQLESHRMVEEALVFNAVASGMMHTETAKDMLAQIKERHTGVKAVMQKKYGVQDVTDMAAKMEEFLTSKSPSTEGVVEEDAKK